MKWLCAYLAVCFIVAPAMAGEAPYIAIVGNDWFDTNRYYLSEKYQDFLYNQDGLGIPVWDPVTRTREQFASLSAATEPEICDPYGYRTWSKDCAQPIASGYCTRGLPNAKTPAGTAGGYEWRIRLPLKPTGEINIAIQCGVLKPSAFAAFGFNAVRKCGAETGERVGPDPCTRQEVGPGESPIVEAALPEIFAAAVPGPNNNFIPFELTAFKNPSTYALSYDVLPGSDSRLLDDGNAQWLAFGPEHATRIVLKSCMEKTIVAKLPVAGQINAGGHQEAELAAGDLIIVAMRVPPENTVDIYCHAQSVKLMGVGESPF